VGVIPARASFIGTLTKKVTDQKSHGEDSGAISQSTAKGENGNALFLPQPCDTRGSQGKDQGAEEGKGEEGVRITALIPCMARMADSASAAARPGMTEIE
jgi:hypothetical protein